MRRPRSRRMSSPPLRAGWARSPGASPRAHRAGNRPNAWGAPSGAPKTRSFRFPSHPTFPGSSIVPPKPFDPLASPVRFSLAGEEGFEPPHPVLETGGLPLNLLPCGSCGRPLRLLLHLAVLGVFSARVAELLGLHPVGMRPLIFRGRVITVLTIVALQGDDFSHDRPLSASRYSMISVTAPAPT